VNSSELPIAQDARLTPPEAIPKPTEKWKSRKPTPSSHETNTHSKLIGNNYTQTTDRVLNNMLKCGSTRSSTVDIAHEWDRNPRGLKAKQPVQQAEKPQRGIPLL